MDNREWLCSLYGEIWKENVQILCGHKKHIFLTIKRELTIDEFNKIKAIAEEHEFIVHPHNAGMGFNFSITFYAPPTYPGLPLEDILSIEGHHLPVGMDQTFNGAWAELSPLSHNKKNELLLEMFGLGPLRERKYYDY